MHSKRRFVVLLGCFLVFTAYAEAIDSSHYYVSASQPAVASSPAEEREPLFATPTHRDRIGRIVVPVMINDRGPFRFLLDTGANHSVLAPHMPSKLGIDASQLKDSVELSGVTGDTVVPIVSIKKLQAGALVIESLLMPIIQASTSDVDGILGMEGMEGKRLVVDFVHDRVTIDWSRNQRPSNGFLALPARLRFGHLLLVDTLVGHVRARAVIDTGTDATLGTETLRQQLRRDAATDREASFSRVEGVTADIQSGDLVLAPPIYFDTVEIGSIRITYGKFHIFELWELEEQPALLIGMDILGTARTLIIDFRRSEVQIEPRNNSLIPRTKKR